MEQPPEQSPQQRVHGLTPITRQPAAPAPSDPSEVGWGIRSGPDDLERCRYRKRACSLSSSAAPGQSCSNGSVVSGAGTSSFCSTMSFESGER